MIIRLLILLALPVFLLSPNLAAQTNIWTKSAGGPGSDLPGCVAVDGSGYIYVVGSFLGDSLVFGTEVLINSSTGSSDIFIVKYAPTGVPLWAEIAGGTGFDEARSVTVDASGNSYVTGVFTSATISFGTWKLTNAAEGYYDFFIVKYAPSGDVIWAEGRGGDGFDYATGIAVHDLGYAYVTGYFSSPSLVFGEDTLTSAGGYDLFVAKYDTGGTVLWAKSAGGTENDYARSVAIDDSGNSYTVGQFGSPTIDFGTGTISNRGGSDIFTVKYDPAGTSLWAISAGGTLSDDATVIAVDDSGSNYITGRFTSSTIDFGVAVLANSGNGDMFVAKYDRVGTPLWARRAGGNASDGANSVTVEGSGDVYVSGSFNSPTIDFGTGDLANAGGSDMFIAKYEKSGAILWAKRTGGTAGDIATSVAVDDSGNSYMVGQFSSPTVTSGNDTLANAGGDDVIIAKYGPGGSVDRAFGVAGAWNMVSVPLTMIDNAKASIYPTAVSNAFTFENGYVSYDTLENGRGYWVKFSTDETISHSGLLRTEDTVAVSAGWNMIGSLSIPIAVSGIGSNPGGIVTSSFYAFDDGYFASPTLEQGKGYWVKVDQAGELIFSTSGSIDPANRIRMIDRGEPPPVDIPKDEM